MRNLSVATILILTLGSALAFTQTKFASEEVALQHCPGDAIVWQVLPGNLFVRKGDARYGATQRGAFMCERDAVAAGNRLAR